MNTNRTDDMADTANQPRYLQIKLAILQRLKTGKWRDGQLIPTESALALQFGVSVGTIRKAVDDLVLQKILVRVQGSGTYVVSQTHDHMLDTFFPIARKDGNKQFPIHQLRIFKKITVDAISAKQLNIDRSEKVFYIESIATLHGQPAIFDKIVLPCSLFPDLTEMIFRNRGKTTFGLYQSRYGINVVRSDEMLVATPAEGAVAQFLQLPEKSPLIEIQRTSYSYDNRPVEFRRRLLNTNSHAYFNTHGMQFK